MTIAFTGGGTGGHFYPLIAIAEAINDRVREMQLVAPALYYLAPEPYDAQALFENRLVFVRIPAGKVRRYFSLQNVSDIFVTLWGTLCAFVELVRIYPDVLVSKGGYASVPSLLAARILRIPVVIHESDAKPGRGSLFAAKQAVKIAISFDSAAAYFPKEAQDKIARTGIPIRKALLTTEPGAREELGLDASVPTVFIIGGSSGALRINETVLSALPDLVACANVIHQTGPANILEVEKVARVILTDNPHKDRYRAFGFLDERAMRQAAGAADLIVSRAGATAIAEIAAWGKPSIIIPIPESISHDQRTNAYAYARTGAAIVVEEGNLSPHLLVAEVKRVLEDPAAADAMRASAKGFTDPDAAKILADAVLSIALQHEH
ncbi:MAG: glycosyltransferase [Patescibacteria group bacterium]|nr:glycosyltransferase [Patescibacteria group bacterium]MDE1943946.1 glycosyltransferase [Patescibacteria group bacterium]MDE1945021.1 glycosyltransferase [Patescibacteria group bacterium]MDE2057527.1 glycosyltransferase [Patescibacteria group bacterium]